MSIAAATRWVVAAALGLAGCTSVPSGERVVDACTPTSIAVDTRNVYWTTAKCDGGSIDVASKNDGSETVLVPTTPTPLSIALDDQFVYWAHYDRYNGDILEIPKGGGQPMVLASGLSGPENLIVDDRYVYWDDAMQAGGVFKVPKDGSAPATPLATGRLGLVGMDSTSLYYLDAQRLGQVLYRQTKDGGPLQVVFEVPDPSDTTGRGVAVTSSGVFMWTDTIVPGDQLGHFDETAALYRVPTEIATCSGGTGATGADDRYLYWFEDRGLVRRPIAGGEIELIAKQASGSHMALDDHDVYWTRSDGIYRVAK